MNHDAEKVIGRIRRDGGWDRRYRPTYQPPEPTGFGWADLAELVGSIVVLSLWIVAIWLMAVVVSA